MNTLDIVGNYGSAIPVVHPTHDLMYTIIKRDVPGSTVVVWERRWDGSLIRIVKAYFTRSDASKNRGALQGQERAAGRPTDYPTEVIDKPVSTPGIVLIPNGNVIVDLTAGVSGGGYAKWHYDTLVGVAPPWGWAGPWPNTAVFSATDTEARRLAQAAVNQAEVAKATSAAGRDVAEEAMKKAKDAERIAVAAGGGGLDGAAVLTTVNDDLVAGRKQPNGQRGGRLVHALWPLLNDLIADIQWIRDNPPKA